MKTTRTVFAVLALFALGFGQAFAQWVGFNLPQASFSVGITGPGYSQFSFGSGNGGPAVFNGMASSAFGYSNISGSVGMQGWAFVPEGATFGTASSWGNVEGGAAAGHFSTPEFNSSYGSSWNRVNAGANASNGGSSGVTVEGVFNGSSELYRPVPQTTQPVNGGKG